MKRSATLVLLLAGLGALLALVWVVSIGGDPAPRAAAPSARFAVDVVYADGGPPPAPEDTEVAWPADGPRTVVGRITDDGGAPVAGARVVATLPGGKTRQATADGAGRYQLDRLRPDVEALVFSATGFEPFTLTSPSFEAAPRVTLDVQLAPLPGVRGRVLVAGAPVAEARLVLRAVGGRRALAVATSDGAGRFAMSWPGDGDYHLSAYHGQHGQARVDVSAPGEVTVELPGGAWIEGRVVDADGDPVPSFSVTASPLTWMSGGPPAQSFESGDGRFELGPLAPGELKVWAAAEGYQPGEVRGITVASGDRITGVVLQLKASTVLTGRVTDARTGRPVVGASVVPAEWRSSALAEAVGAFTGEDGRYTLRALPGVRTSIRVSAEGYRSLLLGGVEGGPGDRLERDFELTPSTDARPQGELTGIGAVLMPHPNGVRLGRLVPDGPASAVLASGDVVVSVGGQSARAMGMQRVAQAIRGEEGTEVVLQVQRGGQGPTEEVVLVRGRVAFPQRHHHN